MFTSLKINRIICIYVVLLVLFGVVNSFKSKYYFTSEVADKIVFEGHDKTSNLSYFEIEEILEAEEQISIFIETNQSYIYPSLMYEQEVETNEDVIEYREALKEIGREHYFLSNIHAASSIELNIFGDAHISQYSPYISAKVDTEILMKNNYELLKSIASKASIAKVFVKADEKENQNFISNAIDGIEFTNYQNTTGYTGSGIRIGMLEYGIIDEDNANFDGKTAVARTVWYFPETVTPHATSVASIMISDEGIAPDASLYSVEWFNSPDGEIEWLLDQNVDIINISAGTSSANYDSDSAYFDYITIAYSVLIVAAAGNEGDLDGEMSNVAMGKNVLAVGGSDSEQTGVLMISSYLTNNGDHKPNVCAPGDGFDMENIGNTGMGTSFSAPIISGLAAVAMEIYPYLKIQPMRMIAIMQASCFYDIDFTKNEWGFYEYAGAGLISFENLLEILNYYDNYHAQIPASSTRGSMYENLFTFTAGKVCKISVIWSAMVSSASSSPSSVKTNVCYLNVVNETTGSVVFSIGTSSTAYLSNKYIAEFVVPTTGDYRIVFGRLETNSHADYLGVAARQYTLADDGTEAD